MGARVPLEIVEAAKNGGAADVERLIEAVWVDAYRLARAIVVQPQCAEDAAQEACAIMFGSISSLRKPDAFSTWFYRIVVREALKQKKLRITAPLPPDVGYSENHTEAIDIWRALAKLPNKLRTVVVLRYFEDLTSRDIGAILGIPEATVRFRLTTARRKLRPLLVENAAPAHSKGEEVYAL